MPPPALSIWLFFRESGRAARKFRGKQTRATSSATKRLTTFKTLPFFRGHRAQRGCLRGRQRQRAEAGDKGPSPRCEASGNSAASKPIVLRADARPTPPGTSSSSSWGSDYGGREVNIGGHAQEKAQTVRSKWDVEIRSGETARGRRPTLDAEMTSFLPPLASCMRPG